MSEALTIDITWTRSGAWYVTFPCGDHLLLDGDTDPVEVRRKALSHRRRCCRAGRLVIEHGDGYRMVGARAS